MKDLRNEKIIKKFNYRNIFIFIKKYKYKLLLTTLILFILIFPALSGSIIGEWIDKFIGSIINNINI